MKFVVALIALGCYVGSAHAEETVRKITWAGSLPEGAARGPERSGSVTVTSMSDEGLTVTLLELEEPGITKLRYALKGRVRYENVDGAGYVEMWNVFDEGRYFTRTNLDQGPMRAITGSSGWRDIVLPFDATGGNAPPRGLLINVVLPGRGKVTLSPMTLVELEEGEWPSGSGGMSGLWGGIAGAVVGTLGGLLGWLGGKGRAKTLVLLGFRVMMTAGAVALAIGILSFVKGAGYDVYYSLVLIGGIAFLVSASALPRLQKQYESIELRRMSALDA